MKRLWRSVVCVEADAVARKEFAHDARGYVLMGDDRDIGISSYHRNAVWDWCNDNNIDLEYQGTLGGTDVWRVRDERQRVAFVLKWS